MTISPTPMTSTGAISDTASNRSLRSYRATPRGLDLALAATLALTALPLGQILTALPSGSHLPTPSLPLAIGIGMLCGTLGMSVHTAADRLVRWPVLAALAPIGFAPFLVCGAALGCLIVAASAGIAASGLGSLDAGLLLLGIAAGLVGALSPYLLLIHSGWAAAGAFGAVALVCWHGDTISPRQLSWLAALAALTAMLITGARARRVGQWCAALGQHMAAHHWRATRTQLLLVALFALLPALTPLLGQVAVPPLQRLWRDSPWQRTGPITSSAVQTTPSVQLGNPLTLDAPPVFGSNVLLSYAIEAAPDNYIAPIGLVGTTFDTYADGRWTQSATTTASWPGFSPDASAAVLQARVTLDQVPHIGDRALLPGFSMAVDYSVPATPRLFTRANGGSPTAGAAAGVPPATASLETADWVATGTVQPGTSYTTTALLIDQGAAEAVPSTLPQDPAAFGWDAETYARLTSIPPALATTLREDASTWATTSSPSSAVGQIEALATTLHERMALASHGQPTAGDEAIADFLATRRGNEATFVTCYVLLLRALGYPARLVEGFAPPTYQNGVQAVRESDFLLWAEVALPQVGWLGVAPTADRVLVTLQHNAAGSSSPPPQQPQQPHPSPRSTPPSRLGQGTPPPPPFGTLPLAQSLGSPWTWALAALLVVLLLALLLSVLVAWLLRDLLLLRRRAAPASYRDLVLALRALLRLVTLARLTKLPPTATPDEVAVLIAAALPEQTQRDAIHTLIDEYERLRFGTEGTSVFSTARAAGRRRSPLVTTMTRGELAGLRSTLGEALWSRRGRILVQACLSAFRPHKGSLSLDRSVGATGVGGADQRRQARRGADPRSSVVAQARA